MRIVALSVGLALALAVSPALTYAGITVTPAPFQTTAFTVSTAGDLIYTVQPSSISGTTDQEGLDSDTTGKALTDGTFGPANPYNVGGSPSMTIMNNGGAVYYALPSASSITSIDTYSAWQDGGRSQQNYQILTSSNNGGSYTPLVTVNGPQDPYGGPYPPENKPSDEMVSITGISLTGVTNIEFYFPSTENGYVGYTELTVYGSPSPTPEPASIAVWGLAIAGGLLVARRRRKA